VKTHTRHAVAYIAGRLVLGTTSTAVYDYQEGRRISMSGNVTGSTISAYDYAQRCHIGGSRTSLYHYGNRGHLTLQRNGAQFAGYDYDSKKHFNGSVNGKSVSLYDYETSQYYNYSI
jgi:hypothetical protein